MNNERIWFFGDYDYSPILDMLQIKEIKTCVVYSFYNKNKEPIYIGKSISFLDRYDWHLRKQYAKEIEYIGFRLYKNEAEMELAELFHIQKNIPKYNKASKYNYDLEMVSFKDFSTEEIFTRKNFDGYIF